MLTEQRYEMILNLLEENKSVTVTQIKELLHISESTARRDITALHQAGKLIKVFGGAVALEGEVISREPTVQQKENVNKEQKIRIAKYAASLIEPDDFVFIDAGTTTAYMIDYITQRNATYVTNAVLHARRLAAAGFRVFLTGGELKGIDVIEKNDQDDDYFNDAMEIVEKGKNGKNINVVDTVSGATYSS